MDLYDACGVMGRYLVVCGHANVGKIPVPFSACECEEDIPFLYTCLDRLRNSELSTCKFE